MATVQVSGVNGTLIAAVDDYANEQSISVPEAWRELTRRGLQSVEAAQEASANE